MFKNYLSIICLILVAISCVGIGANPTRREEISIGGGITDTDGGMDSDSAGLTRTTTLEVGGGSGGSGSTHSAAGAGTYDADVTGANLVAVTNVTASGGYGSGGSVMNVLISTEGAVTSGVDDSSQGTVNSFGGSSSGQGGRLKLYLDGTSDAVGIEHYLIWADGAHLTIGPDTGAWEHVFDATGVVVLDGSTTIGSDNAGVDYTLTFAGEDSDGLITWMEDEDHLKLSDNLVIGADEAGVDYTLTFAGEDSDGVITWDEDNDYFLLADDIFMPAATLTAISLISVSGGIQVDGGGGIGTPTDTDLMVPTDDLLTINGVLDVTGNSTLASLDVGGGSGGSGSTFSAAGAGTFDSTITGGIQDSARGLVNLHGAASAGQTGGSVRLNPAEDYDTTIAYFSIQAYEDDIRIRPDTNAWFHYFRNHGGVEFASAVTAGGSFFSTVGGVFGSPDTTPSVSGGDLWTANGAVQTLTDLDDGNVGQTVRIKSTNGNVTITDGGNLQLEGDWAPDAAGEVITLTTWDGTTWYEDGRSNNN